MDDRGQLRVRVNDDLVLDAGECEVVPGAHGSELLVHAPATTLFHQVLAYLQAKADPPTRSSGMTARREGVAAMAVALRWGSYLAVLADAHKPVLRCAHATGTSRISDEEMARLNIEASAALAEWIDLRRSDRGGGLYTRLVDRAVNYLPLPRLGRMPKSDPGRFALLADPAMATRLVQATHVDRLASVRVDAASHASRIFANALVNVAWRNGPVEDIHAGQRHAYPLDERRMTPEEERELLLVACARMDLGMAVCSELIAERPQRPWAEQVLPYGLAKMMLVTPSDWTLTEASRDVRLPASPE